MILSGFPAQRPAREGGREKQEGSGTGDPTHPDKMQGKTRDTVAGISQGRMRLMRRLLYMTTAIAAVLPPSGRMLVFRDAQGVVRDPYGRKYVGGAV